MSYIPALKTYLLLRARHPPPTPILLQATSCLTKLHGTGTQSLYPCWMYLDLST